MYTYALGKDYIGFKVSNTFIIAQHITCRVKVGKGGERGREREGREREKERESILFVCFKQLLSHSSMKNLLSPNVPHNI